ncbi:MAG: PepSY domain-containing protein [Fimbriimonadales bacterium]
MRERLWIVLALLVGTATMAFAQPAIPTPNLQAQLEAEAPGVLFYREGQDIRRVWGVPFAFGSSPVDTAQSFVNRYETLFTNRMSQLRFSHTQDVMNGKFTAIYYVQEVNGIPVDKGEMTLLVLMREDYPLVLVSNAVRAVEPVETTPKLTAEDAIALLQKVRPDLEVDSKPELVVYLSEAQTHLAWAFSVDNHILEQRERYRVFVDAHTGAVLEWRSEVYYQDIVGQVQGYATPGLRPDTSQNPPVLRTIPKLRLSVIGGSSVYSNLDGSFTLPFSGSGSATVQADLIGTGVRVQNQAGTTLSLQQTVTPPGPANFLFNSPPAEFNTAQMNGLIHTQIVYDFIKSINPNYPGVDIQIPCNVNLNQTCNAYYSNRTINFYRAGGGCVNTCYSTVVYHEYGHFVIAMGHPNAAGDYHEGISDVTAAFLTDDPCLGIEFQGAGTGCIRNSVNSRLHPCSGAVHTCGQVISGAFWQTLLELRQRYGGNRQQALNVARPLYLNSILLRPTGISPQITIDVLTLDDNDGNIYNGTPHYQQIATGFARHNLPAPQIDWVSIQPIVLPAEVVAPPTNVAFPLMRVVVQVSNLAGQVNPNAVFVRYSVNGGSTQSVTLRRMSNTDRYFGVIPVPPCGSTVRYYIEALDTQGRSTFYPREGANAPLRVLSALDFVLTFEDTFETNLGWTVQNDPSLTAGAWVRDVPRGTSQSGQPANPANDSPDAGTRCFFTGQGSVGGAVGEADVDGGPTYVISPVLNLAGGDAVIEYYRWFYNGTVVDDTFFVEVSNDNGATWQRVETVSYQAGVTNQWVRRSFRVGDYVPPTAQVRVRFGTSDNPNNSITEAGVDHFVVRRIVCP